MPAKRTQSSAPPAFVPPVAHRAALSRIERIHQRIRAVQPDGLSRVTTDSLAAELEVSRNTVKHDCDLLRDTFGAPLAWHGGRRTYYYAAPYELRPLLWLDAIEVLAVMVSGRLSVTSRAFPLGHALSTALDKIAPTLGGTVSLQPGVLDGMFSAPADPATETDARHFALLCEAIEHRREVSIVYQKPKRDAPPETRVVRPLHLHVRPDACLLIAHEPSRHGRRNFELTRIRGAQLTGATFAWPAGFELAKYLAGGFGPFIGEPRYEVRIRFAADYAAYVRQKPWHSPQLLVEFPDGTAEATYRVHHLQEVEQRVLSAGGQAEVLAPPELRERVRTAAAKLVEQHR